MKWIWQYFIETTVSGFNKKHYFLWIVHHETCSFILCTSCRESMKYKVLKKIGLIVIIKFLCWWPENIVNYIKAQRLSWFSHVQRMPETGAAKKVFKWNPLTTRPRGSPKHRWEDNIIQNLSQMKIKNWLTCVQDRAKWKTFVEKAKTSN